MPSFKFPESNLTVTQMKQLHSLLRRSVDEFLLSIVKAIDEKPDAEAFAASSPYRFTTGDLLKLMALNQQFGLGLFGHEGFVAMAGKLKSALDAAGEEYKREHGRTIADDLKGAVNE